MSTVQTNQPSQTQTTTPALRACTVAWPIARNAVLKAQPDLGFSTTSTKPIELRINIESETKARVELHDPASGKTHTIELGAPRLTFVDAEPFTHIELTDAETTLLSATLKAEADSHRLLYAKTSALTKLSIKGGRYPAPTLSIF
ncbi:MAG: hypothetical protein Phyf2KO_25720 [Phycisphaerales bacterium]